MGDDIDVMVADLLNDPNLIITKKPFYRGIIPDLASKQKQVHISERVAAKLPRAKKIEVAQEQFLQEYDPNSHKVLYDDSIPKITVKNKKGNWLEVEYAAMAVPFQQNIVAKQVLHLCTNPMRHTMVNLVPTEWQRRFFIKYKQLWQQRNMDGAKTKMVETQKSCGDAGMLFYFDRKGKTRARIISYADGYVICTHKDPNGDHLLEAVYYSENDVETIDCYDDKFMYRFTNSTATDAAGRVISNWRMHTPIRHGFNECPLITKRGDVAWNKVQNIIEVYEVIYNIFLVIQKRHGWGQLYIKGNLKTLGEKVNGSVVMFDNSGDEHADAKYLTPPDPQQMVDTLGLMEETIQKGSGTTFILPKDITVSGDASGVAVQLTQELDIETARSGVSEWQNVANKMQRLFKYGIAKELMLSGDEEYKTAITDSEDVYIHSEFVVWRPQSDEAYNQMLTTLKGAGGISTQTLVEKNTESTPDEMSRIEKEKQQEMEVLQQQQQAVAQNNNASEEVVVTEKA